MPAVPAWLLEPIWVEFSGVIGEDPPEIDPTHPLGCHRRRSRSRVVFEHLIDALVHGSGYEQIARGDPQAPRVRHHRAPRPDPAENRPNLPKLRAVFTS